MGYKKEQELIQSLKWRYATKQFDASRKIPEETWQAIEESLVLTPSSYGMQPWKFLVITDQALREQLVPHSWNQRQVADCSHLVVMLSETRVSAADVDALIARTAEIRGTPHEKLAGYRKIILSDIVEGPRAQYSGEWAARQVYIALGQLMLAAATLSVDTCPMEGFVPAKYDEVLGLEGTGWTTTVLCPCGYRSADDKNAKLPKVRFDAKSIITHR
ncbi:MAG TPA: NAD(P)H-dependent oxidoreductase [Candidatus Omnitrophica bacterium]|nr:NAD(P)H-dependent oxidoreductase [Candidatus Omnitrophota bacterium]